MKKILLVSLFFTIQACTPQTPQGSQQNKVEMPPKVAENQALDLQDEKTLTKEEAVIALIEYIDAVKVKLSTLGVMNSLSFSKMKQDMDWGKLDEYRAEAETMRENAQQIQKDISEIRYPMNATDEQNLVFENTKNAVDDFLIEAVTMNVDLAVGANSGLDMNEELKKDIKTALAAKKILKSKISAACKSFGCSSEQLKRSLDL